MMNQDIIIKVIELLGTFAFAISGIRHAAAKHFDWFGGYVCGIAVAIGGGTIRDVILDVPIFWMTTPIYMICTAVALLTVAFLSKWMEPLKNAWFVFDTFGLALFTIAGIQRSLDAGQAFWVAIIMGCITGAAGGVLRDVLINEVPLIFRKEIYAIACIVGGLVYQFCSWLNLGLEMVVFFSFVSVVLVRVLAVKYHITLPHLKNIER
jgi:uncharacterized membrane protein YeiH